MKTLLIGLCCLLNSAVFSQVNTNKPVLKAAQTFLNSLDSEQKESIQFGLSSEERYRWFFTPVPRKGMDFRKLTDEQKLLARELLHESLSEQGKQTALSIMQLESVLHVMEKHPVTSDHRDPQKYYFSIFGTPSENEAWGWRIEGHHLSLNYTSLDGKIYSSTPLFFGTNPARVPAGMPQPEGTEVLRKETQMGFDFLGTLTPEQKGQAKINEKSPYEIVTSNNKYAVVNQSEGLPYSAMNTTQQKKLLEMLTYYVRRAPDGFSKELLEKIEAAGLNTLHFVWMGGEEWGQGHYYRIHNPVILIEYDCTQNKANHVHTVVRDLTNDWGGDAIAEHIKNDH